MKKNLLNLFTTTLALGGSVSFAQTTLTATGINPVIGESYTLKDGAYLSPGNSGAGQTWNFSTMTGTSAGLTTIVSPSTTPSASSFPTANACGKNTTANNYLYYNTSATAYKNVGLSGGGVNFIYSNPEDFLHFPFALNNSYVDSWAANFVSGGSTWYRTGATTVTADGTGTLITPTATYTNVMRVHFVQAYQDSTYMAGFGPYVIVYDNDEYMWYKNGIHTQIAAVYTLTNDAGGAPSSGGIFLSGTVGINEAADFITSSTVFPNPASAQITVDFTLTENKKVNVQLFKSLGQVVEIGQSAEGIQGVNKMQLDIANLPEGIYFAQILLEGNTAATKRFIIIK
jgi:hypothetical protein